MAPTIDEAFEGRNEVVSNSARVRYLVFGAADENEVKVLAAATIPAVYAGLDLDNIEVGTRINVTTWEVVARYKKPGADAAYPYTPTPDNSYVFDTGSETQHITHSLETTGRFGTKASTELNGAINYDGQEVKGVDIRVPAPTWAETHWYTDLEFTAAYRRQLLKMAFTVNNGLWRGWLTGEVLFIGATCTRRGDDWDDPWEVTYKFAISKNRTGVTMGDITAIAKKGWEYLWVMFAPVEDTAKKLKVKKAVAVFTERVYEFSDFALLGIDAP